MAKTKISEYSATANNNTDINSINLAEGMAPSLVNNAIRQLMAQLKDFQAGTAGDSVTVGGNLSVTGTSTLTGAITATGGVSGAITSSSATITGGTITGITDLAIADGGTGASTAVAALNNLLPSQTSNANKYLQTDGVNATWDAVTLSTADITGTLAVANGGTGVTSSTGTGNVVLSTSPTLVTPALGTPSALVGTNITGTASGLTAGNVTTNANLTGAVTSVGNATSLGSFTSAQLLGALTDETGTGSAVFATSPTLVTPALGTPSALVGTNITGTAAGLTAGSVTTNANLTGDVTSVGNATTLTNAPVIAKVLTGYVSGAGTVAATDSILQAIQKLNGNDATNANLTGMVTSVGNATTVVTNANLTGAVTSSGNATSLGSFSSANLLAALTDETGTGSAVFATSPTLVTPILGTPTSATLTNATGLPLTTGVTGTLPIANGGSGQTTATAAFNALAPAQATNSGKYLTTDGTNSSWATVSGGSGTVTSVAVSGGTTGLTTSGGPVTTSGTITLAGTLAVANGGTGTTTPSIVAGTNITVTGTWPNQTIAASAGGSGTVTSVAATVPSVFSVSGSPITTSGTLAMTYSGTALPVANGGTGQTSYTDGQLLIGNSTGNTLTKATLTAGTNVTITNSAGAITIAASGGGTPAGVNTQIQYNNSGAFGASANLTFDGSTLTTIGGSAGNVGAYTAILKNSDNANSGSIQLGGATYGALIYRDSAGANSELIFTNSHAGNKGFKFFTGSNIQGTTQLAAIGATGCIAVGTATPSTDGSGITFPATQSASSDANTLDDYEEGTWTPAITDDIGAAVMTSGASGFYTKVGRMVTVTFNEISWSSKGTLATAPLYISGLPFTSRSTNRSVGLLGGGSSGSFTNANRLSLQLEANATRVTIYNVNNTTNGLIDYNVTSLGTSGVAYGMQITYFV